MSHHLTLVSMSGLRVGCDQMLELGMRLPGLAKRGAAIAELPPLGLLTIAAIVPDGWSTQLISDLGAESVRAAAERIMETRPDVVAFSALTPSVDRAGAISRLLRGSGVTTVIGGLHATAAPGSCAENFDVVVRGDGEVSFPKVLNDWGSDRLQKSYIAETPFDLGKSPLPRWDLLGPAAPPRYTLQTMRGCPWACSFCAASRLLGPARIKPDDRIADELVAIKKLSSRPLLELADDNTFSGQRDHERMLELLAESEARWFTESDWRVGLQVDLLGKIAKSGCRQILVGLESSVHRYSGMGAKSAERSQIVEATEAMQEAGIVVNACFVIGADGETSRSIDELGDFLEIAPFGEIQLTLQTPFPGTSLHRTLQRTGRLHEGDYSRFTLFDVVYDPDPMTAQQLQSRFLELVERVFRPSQQRRRDEISKQVRRRGVFQ